MLNQAVLQPVTRKVRNVLRGLLQLYGTRDMKQRLWDHEFASGKWKCLEVLEADELPAFIARYAKGGRILDLGCGPGARVNALSDKSYSLYTGVDISEVAIDKAQKKTEVRKGRGKVEYAVADICGYVPSQKYDVVVLAESIYYIPVGKIPGMLARYSGYLNPGGVFITTINGPYPAILKIIETQYMVVHREKYSNSDAEVLVFRTGAAH
jgi:SAM-dependent methyltransferase